jgi:dienelactone hydrolase
MTLQRTALPWLVLLCGLASSAWGAEKSAATGAPQAPHPLPAVRAVDLIAADGAILRASYYAAAAPGPGVLLFHQSNRTRQSWDEVAHRLAAAGINTLTVDMRGTGESGGSYDKWTGPTPAEKKKTWTEDIELAWQFLASQPGVRRELIGVGGAGVDGVDNAVQTARRHAQQVKSLALLSGETLQDNLQFLHQASQLPELFVVADDDEYPPTVEAMKLLYVTATSASRKFIHYPAASEVPWIWYEPIDMGRVPANGGHGTDLFKGHPELPGTIVDWFTTTLIKTPGHAPADTLASAATINLIRTPGGIAQVKQQLQDARRQDPRAQLFPEISVSIIGQDHLRAGEAGLAVEILELVLLSYPDSADAHETLAEAYLKNRQKDLARQHAEKALELLGSHTVPASSWTDAEAYRGEIRHGALHVLTAFRDKQP